MVGVREFYEKDGEALPGKKGISMTIEQFNTVVGLLPQIERELKGKGIELVRPRYDQVEGDAKEEEEDEEEVEGDEAGEKEDDVGEEAES